MNTFSSKNKYLETVLLFPIIPCCAKFFPCCAHVLLFRILHVYEIMKCFIYFYNFKYCFILFLLNPDYSLIFVNYVLKN